MGWVVSFVEVGGLTPIFIGVTVGCGGDWVWSWLGLKVVWSVGVGIVCSDELFAEAFLC